MQYVARLTQEKVHSPELFCQYIESCKNKNDANVYDFFTTSRITLAHDNCFSNLGSMVL